MSAERKPISRLPVYRIAETEAAVWSYHLRLVPPSPLDSSTMTTLCGRKAGWDTRIPLLSWGTEDHMPSHWCQECAAKFAAEAPTELLKTLGKLV